MQIKEIQPHYQKDLTRCSCCSDYMHAGKANQICIVLTVPSFYILPYQPTSKMMVEWLGYAEDNHELGATTYHHLKRSGE